MLSTSTVLLTRNNVTIKVLTTELQLKLLLRWGFDFTIISPEYTVYYLYCYSHFQRAGNHGDGHHSAVKKGRTSTEEAPLCFVVGATSQQQASTAEDLRLDQPL